MICPDCREQMIKTAIQCCDLSGWSVGWLCECDRDDTIELTIHSSNDWTAEIING